VNGLLSYPGIYPNVYIASHMIKELNLKFKIKENPNGIKRETIILQYCI